MADSDNSLINQNKFRLPRGSVLKSFKGSRTEILIASEKQPKRNNGNSPSLASDINEGLDSNNTIEFDKSSLQEVFIPPDGGYGWVVVFAAFLSNVIADGVIYSFGSLRDPIHQAFHQKVPKSSIAWVGSITTACYLFVGPVVAAISNRYGFRVAAVTGSIIASIGLGIAWTFCQFYLNLPALIIGYGIIGGIGLGFIYMPAVVAPGFYFEKKRSLATGISMCGSGIGTFLVPPIIDAIIKSSDWPYSILFSAGIVLLCIPLGLFYRPLRPTIVYNEHCRVAVVTRASFAGAPFIMPFMIASSEYTEDFQEITDNRNSTVKYMSDTNILEGLSPNERRKSIILTRYKSTIPTFQLDPSEEKGDVGTLPEKTPVTQDETLLMEPERLDLDKNASNSSGNIAKEEREIVVVRHKEPCCPTCFDFSLLYSSTFNLTLLSGFLNMVGLFIPFIYLKEIAANAKVEDYPAVPFVSIIGIGTCFGRLIGGWIADLPKVNDLFVCNCSITVMGVSTAIVPFLNSYGLFIVYSLVFGFSMGCSSGLRPTILTQLLGLERLTNAFGLTLVVLGVGSMIGSPFIGKIQEWAGNKPSIPFFVAGGCMTLSGVINYPLSCVKAWEDRRAEGKAA